MSRQSSGLKSEQSKKPAWSFDPERPLTFNELHSVRSQEIELFKIIPPPLPKYVTVFTNNIACEVHNFYLTTDIKSTEV
jgi:hypothetical protein